MWLEHGVRSGRNGIEMNRGTGHLQWSLSATHVTDNFVQTVLFYEYLDFLYIVSLVSGLLVSC